MFINLKGRFTPLWVKYGFLTHFMQFLFYTKSQPSWTGVAGLSSTAAPVGTVGGKHSSVVHDIFICNVRKDKMLKVRQQTLTCGWCLRCGLVWGFPLLYFLYVNKPDYFSVFV